MQKSSSLMLVGFQLRGDSRFRNFGNLCQNKKILFNTSHPWIGEFIFLSKTDVLGI